MHMSLWLSFETMTSFPPDSSAVFKGYNSLKVTKIKSDITSCHLPWPHIPMELNSSTPSVLSLFSPSI